MARPVLKQHGGVHDPFICRYCRARLTSRDAEWILAVSTDRCPSCGKSQIAGPGGEAARRWTQLYEHRRASGEKYLATAPVTGIAAVHCAGSAFDLAVTALVGGNDQAFASRCFARSVHEIEAGLAAQRRVAPDSFQALDGLTVAQGILAREYARQFLGQALDPACITGACNSLDEYALRNAEREYREFKESALLAACRAKLLAGERVEASQRARATNTSRFRRERSYLIRLAEGTLDGPDAVTRASQLLEQARNPLAEWPEGTATWPSFMHLLEWFVLWARYVEGCQDDAWERAVTLIREGLNVASAAPAP